MKENRKNENIKRMKMSNKKDFGPLQEKNDRDHRENK